MSARKLPELVLVVLLGWFLLWGQPANPASRSARMSRAI